MNQFGRCIEAISERQIHQWQRIILRKDFDQHTGLSALCWKRRGLKLDSKWTHNLWQKAWFFSQVKKKYYKFETGRTGVESHEWVFLEWAQSVKNFILHVNHLQRHPLWKRQLKHKVYKWTQPININQCLVHWTQYWQDGFMNAVATVEAMEDMNQSNIICSQHKGLSSYGCH